MDGFVYTDMFATKGAEYLLVIAIEPFLNLFPIRCFVPIFFPFDFRAFLAIDSWQNNEC